MVNNSYQKSRTQIPIQTTRTKVRKLACQTRFQSVLLRTTVKTM